MEAGPVINQGKKIPFNLTSTQAQKVTYSKWQYTEALWNVNQMYLTTKTYQIPNVTQSNVREGIFIVHSLFLATDANFANANHSPLQKMDLSSAMLVNMPVSSA